LGSGGGAVQAVWQSTQPAGPGGGAGGGGGGGLGAAPRRVVKTAPDSHKDQQHGIT